MHPWSSGQQSRSNILAGSAWRMASWLLAAATALPLQVVLVRLMSRPSFGTYALAMSIIEFVIPFASFGLQGSVAKHAAEALASHEQHGLSAVARDATRMTVYLVMAVLLIVASVSLIMNNVSSLSPVVPVFLALAPVAFVAPLGEAAMGLIQATFQPKLPLISGALRSGLLLALTVGALEAGSRSAMSVTVARSVAVGVGTITLVLCSGWIGHLRARPKRSLGSKPFVTSGLAMLATTTFFVAVSQLDVIFLGGFRGNVAAGAYAPVSAIADAIGSIFAVLAGYALPAMTAARVRGKDADLFNLTRWTSRWGLVLCAPALGAMAATPGPLLQILFGDGSTNMVIPTRILALGVTIDVLLGFNTFAVLALGRPRVLTRNALLGLIVSLIACATMVPRLGAIGAATSTTTAVFFLNGLASSFLWRRVKFPPWDRPLFLTAVVFVTGTVAAMILSPLTHNDFASLAVAAAATGIPTLLTSLWTGGAADRGLLVTGLNAFRRKIRLRIRQQV